MTNKKPRLGELLIEAGVLHSEQLEKALALQKKRQLRLGTILLQEAFISEAQLVQALSRRLSIPWVNLWHIDIEDELLDLVPASVAEEFFLIPIYIRTTGSGERALYVAMNDPTDDSALRFVAAASGMPVKPMIAAPSEISAAIRAYYYGEEEPSLAPAPPPVSHSHTMRGTAAPPPPTHMSSTHQYKTETNVPPLPPTPAQVLGNGEKSPLGAMPPGIPPSKPIVAEDGDNDQKKATAFATSDSAPIAKDEETPIETSKEAIGIPPSTQTTDTSANDETGESKPARISTPPKIPDEAKTARPADRNKAQREVEKHMFGVGGQKRRGISLTLLDGTTIDFGVANQKKDATSDTITQEDLIAGLKAAANGTPMEGFLPSENWQDYMAVLLQIMFKKHLVFFNEFMKEIKELKEKNTDA